MHKAGKVVTRECRKAKSAELEFAFVSALSDNSSFGLNILYTIYIYILYMYYIYTLASDGLSIR